MIRKLLILLFLGVPTAGLFTFSDQVRYWSGRHLQLGSHVHQYHPGHMPPNR